MDDVQADGTAEGCFELVVLQTMGAQFYQYWHAGYNDTVIVCDRAGLAAVFAATDEFLNGRTVAFDVRQQAQTLDFTPTVTFRGDTVFVRVVTFTKWGGFIEEIYSMNRDLPHRLSIVDGKVLVPYDCGIMF
ncbi:MAG: hypothetical protein KKA73_22755 [Chloroflexi bacterium]|nr:hypothetical protein [Chloroflexota bacterium]MBU1750513.1 hypothetical protein [Chloroflexota bacterium]